MILNNFVRKTIVFALLVLGLAVLSGCGSKDVTADDSGKKGDKKKGNDGPVPVVVATALKKDVPVEVTAVGNVEAFSTITVMPQVSGQLTQVFIQEGDYVKKGDKLFMIDPRPLQAQVAQAEANLSKDTAGLGQARANLARDTASERYTREQAERYAKLFEEGVVSKADRDNLSANADAAGQLLQADKAAIQSVEAQIQADKAAVDNLKLQLSFTTIYSPIDGRSGNITVKGGNIVTANMTALMSITQIEPIYVTFSVPEARLSDIQRYSARNKLMVEAKSQDGLTGSDHGALSFVDNNVDATTGTIKLKGTFDNRDRQLWPGEFVNVILRLAVQPNSIVVPNQAVQTGQDGSYIYVVKDDHTVEARPVTLGLRVDPEIVIDKGLREGETVVTEGQLRLAPGSHVQFSDNGKKKVQTS